MAITQAQIINAIASNPKIIYDYVNPILTTQQRATLRDQLFPAASDAVELQELLSIRERLEGLNKNTVAPILTPLNARITALGGS